jgi:hypothetical protein
MVVAVAGPIAFVYQQFPVVVVAAEPVLPV